MALSALTTDFYELTMMQGYFLTHNNPKVVFDMFYRTNPFDGGYVVFAGLQDLLDRLTSFSFQNEDIEYLRSLKMFDETFLSYLSDFRFSGTIDAMEEGTVVFPGEPLVRVSASLVEAQVIESLLLNTINFQSLIATKASRMYEASKGGKIMEFGLRRAQGLDGALSASRAAFIGGTCSTSNTLAGKTFGIPVTGTMAHSWVMAFEDELDAFRSFARIYPESTTLLIDTYDTLGSGIENAIIVAKELQQQGKSCAVRIDSGDLNYLSREIRKRLDAAGLPDCRIAVSNDLSEEIIETLVHDNVPIDSWGIGTHLVTGGAQSSLNGVYKLAARQLPDTSYLPTMKITNSFEKATNPGIKQVWRFYDAEDSPLADLITLADETISPYNDHVFYHPFSEADFFIMKKSKYVRIEPMLKRCMEEGRQVTPVLSLQELQQKTKKNLASLHPSYKRIINPHIYKVSLSRVLKELKKHLVLEGRERIHAD